MKLFGCLCVAVFLPPVLLSSIALQAQIKFSTPIRYDFPFTLTGYSLVVADLNRDGRQDLIASTDTGFAVFLIRGDGTLPPPKVYSVPGFGTVQSLAVADFNQDGWPDVAIATGSSVFVLLNRGDGTLADPVAYPVSIPFGAGALAAGDFNHDGYPDLILTFIGDVSDESQMFLNKGNGTFTPLSVHSLGYGRVLAADLNNDGYADIISHESITTFLNTRHTLTQAGWNASFLRTDICGGCYFGLMVNHSDTGFVVADINGDGFPDIVSGVLGAVDQTPLVYYKNRGDGTFGPDQGSTTGPWHADVRGLVAADFDGDGLLDLAASSDNEFRFARNLGGGVFSPVQAIAYPTSSYTSGFNLVALDLNDDGQPDPVIAASCTPYCGSQSFLLASLNQTNPSVKIRGPSLFPGSGGNSGTVTATISIPGLQPGATIKLTAPGQPDIIGSNPTLSTYYGTQVLTATFDLTGAALGSYSVVIMVGGATILTIPSGFTVVLGGAADVWIDFVGRSVLRAGQQQTYYLTIGNRGNLDAYSAEVWLQIPSFLNWSADPAFQPSRSVATADGFTTLFYELVGNIAAGSASAVPIRLLAPDDPNYAHMIFHIGLSETVPQ